MWLLPGDASKGSLKSTPTMKGRMKIMSEAEKNLPARTTPVRSASAMPSLGPEQSLNRYLAEIRKFPVLTAEQEYMLAKRYAEHQDPEAAKQLVTSHLRLVAKIAMGYRGYGLPVAELISEGNIGLMQGVKCHVVDQGEHAGIYPAQLVAGQNGHHRSAEEAVFQPAADEKEPRCV
jgi:DNA-directed RNA polymerase sigma subunit (sigma70/sigma32)